MNGWMRRFPLRKGLALLSTLWCLVIAGVSFWLDRDIPAGAAGVLQALIVTAIGGYCGSSAAEAIAKGREEKE